ncbi:MAG: tRNA (guanine(10)-N(2))-dimethyltransferase [Candidatus Bathyarchaeia archaeon]
MSESDFITVEEGLAQLLIPKTCGSTASTRAPVFYNPMMRPCRDVSVLALQAYQQTHLTGLQVCDAMSGCGARGVRYALEVDGVSTVVFNDLNPLAVDLIKRNVALNSVEARSVVHRLEANRLFSSYSEPGLRFHVIDLDPFGSPARYLDSLIRAAKKEGLVMVTATDMAPLSGVHPMTCLKNYGGKPLHTEYVKETAIRLVVSALVRSAAVQDMAFEPLLCYYQDYYVRAIGSVSYGSRSASATLRKLGFILHCFRCLNRESVEGFSLPKTCVRCGQPYSIAGPLWLGELFDTVFLSKMETILQGMSYPSKKRTARLISCAREEAGLPPTFFLTDALCDRMNIPLPRPALVMDALAGIGYRVARSHIDGNAIKTDAPISDVEEAIRYSLA